LAAEFMKVSLIKGAVATTAIEGNTLTEDQVKRILEGKLTLPPSKAYLQREVDNVIAACNKLNEELHREAVPPLSLGRIKEWNRQILEGLELEEGVVPGEVRSHSVTVGRYLGAPAEDCEHLLEELCTWLPTLTVTPDDLPDMKMPFAIIQAILAHLYLAWIHPFGDGNGRTARMVELQLLVQAGVPAVAAHLLSNHYNQTRTEYYRQLDRASRSGGDIVPFLQYASVGLVDGLRDQINQVNDQQMDLAWQDYIHEQIFKKASSNNERRFQLAKVLSRAKEFVLPDDLVAGNAKLRSQYRDKTPKTLTRDLNELISSGLVERDGRRFRARVELICAFLPKALGGS
jgi:Fic family protein